MAGSLERVAGAQGCFVARRIVGAQSGNLFHNEGWMIKHRSFVRAQDLTRYIHGNKWTRLKIYDPFHLTGFIFYIVIFLSLNFKRSRRWRVLFYNFAARLHGQIGVGARKITEIVRLHKGVVLFGSRKLQRIWSRKKLLAFGIRFGFDVTDVVCKSRCNTNEFILR